MSAHSLDLAMTHNLVPSSQVSSTTIHEHHVCGNDTCTSEKASYYVEFEPEDERNPTTYTRRKKWGISFTASFFTMLAAAAAGSYNMGFSTMIPDLNCTEFQATIGLSIFPVGFGVTPLITASFSEEFGRQPLYIVSIIGFMIMQIGVGFSKNIQTVIVLRFLQGAFGSTGSTMVGGTIADIWMPHERGLPMAVIGLAAIAGSGIGPFVAGWVVMNHRLDWRWIQWISASLSAVCFVAIVLFMHETRSTVLLAKLARKIRKETGDQRYRARIEDEGVDLKRLIYISCTRPILLLTTEPIVASFSIWVGFAWGIVFVLLESIAPVFRDLHNFNSGQIGSVFVAMIIGALLGFSSNFYQDVLYQKYFPKRGVEARLYTCIAAGVLFPAGMLMYGLACLPSVHWIVPVIAITLFMFAGSVIYIGSFTYLADCYGIYASSAVAGSALCRNIAATALPLFTRQMYDALTYRWANILFAGVGLLMAPVPLILFYFGPRIRARSQFARKLELSNEIAKSRSKPEAGDLSSTNTIAEECSASP